MNEKDRLHWNGCDGAPYVQEPAPRRVLGRGMESNLLEDGRAYVYGRYRSEFSKRSGPEF